MDRELETKKLLCNNLYTLRKQNGATRRKVAIACGKNEETIAANVWGSNIELLANLKDDEDPAEVTRRFKKCPYLTVQDLLSISEFFHTSPMEMLAGAENLYDLPVADTKDDAGMALSAIKEKIGDLNETGIKKIFDYMTDLLKIEEYRK